MKERLVKAFIALGVVYTCVNIFHFYAIHQPAKANIPDKCKKVHRLEKDGWTQGVIYSCNLDGLLCVVISKGEGVGIDCKFNDGHKSYKAAEKLKDMNDNNKR